MFDGPRAADRDRVPGAPDGRSDPPLTGDGDLSMVATGPGGRRLRPVWGPEPHSGSSYHRPGDEWGTGWTFPVRGCWTIDATRRIGSARIAIRVA